MIRNPDPLAYISSCSRAKHHHQFSFLVLLNYYTTSTLLTSSLLPCTTTKEKKKSLYHHHPLSFLVPLASGSTFEMDNSFKNIHEGGQEGQRDRKRGLQYVLNYWPLSISYATAGRVVQKWRQFKEGNGVDCGKAAASVYISILWKASECGRNEWGKRMTYIALWRVFFRSDDNLHR